MGVEEYRAKIFAKLYDKMFTLFYFENKFFTKFNLNTKFVGHQIFYKNKTEKKKKLYVFLPGSRNVEIRKKFIKDDTNY